MNKTLAERRLDLWVLAGELIVTPEGEDLGSRGSRRAASHRRRRIWTALIGSSVLTVACGVAAVTMAHPIGSSVLTVIAALALGFAAGAATALLRARAYRRLTSGIKRGATPVWWTFTSFAWVLLLPAGVVAVVSVAAETSFRSESAAVAVKMTTCAVALVGVLLSASSSASAPPLLSASSKPRPYQAHWSQITWTAAMIALTLAVVSLFVWRDQDTWLVELAVTIGFGVIAALFAWHARALYHLRQQRKLLIDALLTTYEAIADDEAPRPTAVRALLTLRSLVLPGPFRSQSPAAPPVVAGWEITEIVAVILYSYGYGDMPEAVTSRALHDDDFGQGFRHVAVADGSELRDAGREFVKEAIEWVR